MAIKVKVSCSMCGDSPDLKFYIESPKEFDLRVFKKQVESQGWIVQINGDHIDTYCTKKCAK